MTPPALIDRNDLVDAFDAIGRAATVAGTRLEIAVYGGGSALMLAGNFRFATEDVDIAALDPPPWPSWLKAVVDDIASRNGWAPDWLNEAVTVHLSPHADRAADHVGFGTFPRDAHGLTVHVPSAAYMLALKLKAIRIMDPVKGQSDADDIFNLMRVLDVDTDGAMAILKRYFPRSGLDDTKQRFLLKHLAPSEEAKANDAPRYPG